MSSDTSFEEQVASLSGHAVLAASHAYAPYSNFFVGAAILLASGQIVTGCNVENASFRLTTCAEQNAITSAVAQFGPELRILAVAVANRNGTAGQPCGACLQTIAEFASPQAVILFPGAGGQPSTSTLAALLPATFRLS